MLLTSYIVGFHARNNVYFFQIYKLIFDPPHGGQSLSNEHAKLKIKTFFITKINIYINIIKLISTLSHAQNCKEIKY